MNYAECECEERFQRRCFVGRLTRQQADVIGYGQESFESWPNCEVTLLDRFTGKSHVGSHRFPVIEDDGLDGFSFGPHEFSGNQYSLDKYMLMYHFCGCHRESIIREPIPRDRGTSFCNCSRFIVERVTHPAFPGVILYYEEPKGEYKGTPASPEELLEAAELEEAVVEIDRRKS